MSTKQHIPLDAAIKYLQGKGWMLLSADDQACVFKGPKGSLLRLERHPQHPEWVGWDTAESVAGGSAASSAPPVAVVTKTAPAADEDSSSEADPEKIYQQIKAHPQLPSPNTTALEVMNLCTAGEVDHKRLEKVISGDMALAARVMQHINAAYYGLSRKIDSLQRAIQLLGPRRIRTMVLNVTTIAQLRQGSCEAFDYESCWSGAVAQGHAAEHLVAAQGDAAVSANTAFTAGLFSRLGQLTLATVYPERYGELLLAAKREPAEILRRWEQKRFGMDSYDLAARLLFDWHLPEYVCRAVAYQSPLRRVDDLPVESPERRLTLVLAWADAAAGIIVTHYKTQNKASLDRLLAMAGGLGLDLEPFARHFHQIGLGWVDTGKILNLEVADVTSWDDLYAGAH